MTLSNGGRFVIIAACAVNAVSCVASVAFNGLAMFIIKKSPSLHKPAFVLLFALALTDFIIGFLVQPFYIWKLAAIFKANKELPSGSLVQKLDTIVAYIRLASIVITLLLLTAVSFDRCLALYMKTRYKLVVTVKRAILVSVLLWSGGAAAVVVVLMYKANHFIAFSSLLFVFLTLTLFIVNSRKLVKQQNTVANYQRSGQPSSSGNHQELSGVVIARYKRILTSLKYCFGAFLISYLPLLCAGALWFLLEESESDWVTPIFSVVVTINLANSAVNPVLYYWKIPFVRSEIKRLFKMGNTN